LSFGQKGVGNFGKDVLKENLGYGILACT